MCALAVLLAPLIVLGVILALAGYVAALGLAALLDLVRSC
jgi:hypothetical protein